jgi:hypothetical protein
MDLLLHVRSHHYNIYSITKLNFFETVFGPNILRPKTLCLCCLSLTHFSKYREIYIYTHEFILIFSSTPKRKRITTNKKYITASVNTTQSSKRLQERTFDMLKHRFKSTILHFSALMCASFAIISAPKV